MDRLTIVTTPTANDVTLGMERLTLVITPTANGEARVVTTPTANDATLGMDRLTIVTSPTAIDGTHGMDRLTLVTTPTANGEARLPRNTVSHAPNSWSLGRLRSSCQRHTEMGLSCHQCGEVCGDLDSLVKHWRKMKDLRHASTNFPYKDYPGKFQECVLCHNGPYRSLALHGPHCPASKHWMPVEPHLITVLFFSSPRCHSRYSSLKNRSMWSFTGMRGPSHTTCLAQLPQSLRRRDDVYPTLLILSCGGHLLFFVFRSCMFISSSCLQPSFIKSTSLDVFHIQFSVCGVGPVYLNLLR